MPQRHSCLRVTCERKRGDGVCWSGPGVQWWKPHLPGIQPRWGKFKTTEVGRVKLVSTTSLVIWLCWFWHFHTLVVLLSEAEPRINHHRLMSEITKPNSSLCSELFRACSICLFVCYVYVLTLESKQLHWSIFNFLLGMVRSGGLWLLVELSLTSSSILCSSSFYAPLSFCPSLTSCFHWLQHQTVATMLLVAVVSLALSCLMSRPEGDEIGQIKSQGYLTFFVSQTVN